MDQCRDSRLNAWASGAATVPQAPFQAYISPTNLCSNRCVMCPHDRVMRKDRGVMSMELFKKIVAELPKGIVRVYMLKQGEPLLNKNLPDMLSHLKAERPEIHLSVHTNLTVPVRDKLPQMLEAVDSLGLSISALDGETYRRTHGKDHFEAVMKNLEAINEYLPKMSDGMRPHVFITYVRQKANANESEEQAIKFYESRFPNLGSVDFHPMFNWQGDVEEANFDVDETGASSMYPCCIMPWSTIAICHDGKVSYCQEESKENVFIGETTETSVTEAWNSAEYKEFRSRMANRQYDALLDRGFYCKQCSYLWNHHSQSPQNLTQGYFKRKNQTEELKFGNLLALEAEDLLKHAAAFYLSGEMHKAMGCVEHLRQTDCPEELRPQRDELDGLCKAVISQFRTMYKAKTLMKKAGAEIKPNRYHRIGCDR
jgi:radical SAM protein with 4Fe4S-binding SPASM domain